jgi:hypothetical protein
MIEAEGPSHLVLRAAGGGAPVAGVGCAAQAGRRERSGSRRAAMDAATSPARSAQRTATGGAP